MKKEICKNCTFYTAYYEKCSSCYHRLNHGYCHKHTRQQFYSEGCEQFKSNEKKEQMRLECTFGSLEQALVSIIEISQILKENYTKIPN